MLKCLENNNISNCWKFYASVYNIFLLNKIVILTTKKPNLLYDKSSDSVQIGSCLPNDVEV